MLISYRGRDVENDRTKNAVRDVITIIILLKSERKKVIERLEDESRECRFRNA